MMNGSGIRDWNSDSNFGNIVFGFWQTLLLFQFKLLFCTPCIHPLNTVLWPYPPLESNTTPIHPA